MVRVVAPSGASQRRSVCTTPALDPAVIKLIDALARAQAKEDHNREDATQPSQ
jgi:hypothetical protein